MSGRTLNVNARTLVGPERRYGMDWLNRLLPPHRTPDEARRDKRTVETLTLVDDFMAEMRESIRAVKETGTDDRKGFPVEHALRRRRPL